MMRQINFQSSCNTDNTSKVLYSPQFATVGTSFLFNMPKDHMLVIKELQEGMSSLCL